MQKEGAREEAGEECSVPHAKEAMGGFQATAEKLFLDGSPCLIGTR